MAPRLSPQLVAAMVFGGAIATLALWPTRKNAPARDVRVLPTSARLRAQEAAERWRLAEAERRLAEYRRRLDPDLALYAEHGGAALLVIAPHNSLDADRARYRALLDTVWHSLGLGVTKVTVGVVVDLGDDSERSGRTPPLKRGVTLHVLPDSTDRTTCLAVLSPALGFARAIGPASGAGQTRAREWMATGLGPCAFYAAYGAPGRPVRRWLGHHHFDIAEHPPIPGDSAPHDLLAYKPAPRRWFYDWVYVWSPAAVGCLGGRPDDCRTAVLAGADEREVDVIPPRLVQRRTRWRERTMLEGGRFLADVAQEAGPVRFQRFWISTQPVEAALETALGSPVGEWTERWQRRFGPEIPLGPSIPASAVWLGLSLAAGAIAATAAAVHRRQAGSR
jgi:hypothetical protein